MYIILKQLLKNIRQKHEKHSNIVWSSHSSQLQENWSNTLQLNVLYFSFFSTRIFRIFVTSFDKAGYTMVCACDILTKLILSNISEGSKIKFFWVLHFTDSNLYLLMTFIPFLWIGTKFHKQNYQRQNIVGNITMIKT